MLQGMPRKDLEKTLFRTKFRHNLGAQWPGRRTQGDLTDRTYTMTILQDVSSLQAQLDKLTAENAALKAKAMSRQTITMKVSDKGCLSVYGLGRFPVTLYAGQWQKLLSPAVVDGIAKFIDGHRDQLAWKD